MTPAATPPAPPDAALQQQFLDVVGPEEAARRFAAALDLTPRGVETVALADALGRVLAERIASPVDVPGFDRSLMDGFAVRSADTHGAREDAPRVLRLTGEILTPGVVPQLTVAPGLATVIATGAMLPRGADAVAKVEDTGPATVDGAAAVTLTRGLAPGAAVAFAGSDIARGETVLRAGQVLTSRELGTLAAVGRATLPVYRRPRIAVISTGDELAAPGEALPPGGVYDSNGPILAAALRELGCEPVAFGAVPDDLAALQRVVDDALACDGVILSGGTSKGAGDLSYQVVGALDDPGIVVHGVAIKPGKPLCLAATAGKPVVILPGFPTSAMVTFHQFVAPVLRTLAGLPAGRRQTVAATLPTRVTSEPGRTEYLLVGLIGTDHGYAAYPIAKGSGSVTSFGHADGFIEVDARTEVLPADSPVEVMLLSDAIAPADLTSIGSHCVGLDHLLQILQGEGVTAKYLSVGSQAGVAAARRGECDIAGIHLMDPATGIYNEHFADGRVVLVPGYLRLQGVAFRPDDARFEGAATAAEAVARALADPDAIMVNRNAGSGTRVLVDQLLAGAEPPGYAVQPSSHNAVAAAVAQGRADWGVTIETVARQYGLGFLPLQEEHYDFLVPRSRLDRPAVARFVALLRDPAARAGLEGLGFRFGEGAGDDR